jgi:hypothetical protein
VGKDTHALSGPAQRTAIEVLAANGTETIIQRDDGVTPTPAISRAILVHNRGRAGRLADGIVVTPSHNPPEDQEAALAQALRLRCRLLPGLVIEVCSSQRSRGCAAFSGAVLI